MSYRDILVKLGDQTVEKVLRVYTLMQAGEVTYLEAVGLMSVLIGKSQARAVALAETSLAAELTLGTRTAVGIMPTGVVPNMTKLRGGARVVLATVDSTPDPEGRIERMARNLTYEAGGSAYSKGIKRSSLVEGWTRNLEPDACQLCVWWWREGRTWPKEHIMPQHKGCTCTPLPVFQESIHTVGKGAKARSNRDRVRQEQQEQSEVETNE